MTWLGTWAKRRKITVDSTKFSADLTHFPVPVALSSSAGISNADLADIFTDLGSSSKKIAVTAADGETQLYCEIESWSPAVEQTESFNKTDGNTLGPDLSWTVVGSTFATNSNRATLVSTGGVRRAYAPTLASPNHYVEATLDAVTNSGATVRLCARMDATAGTFYALEAVEDNTGSGYCYIVKFVGNTRTVLLDTTTSYAFPFHARLEVEGSTLRAYLEGYLLGTVEDTSVPGTGLTGISGLQTTGSSVFWENFESGDLESSALLWVSKSDWSIDSDTDTDLYLYWDSAQADNTTYVGDTGSRTEVWDADFAVVHHMNGLVDSTSNNLDATLTDVPVPTYGAMPGSQAYDFDGSNDLFVIPDSTVYNVARSELTIEGWLREDAYTQYRGFWAKGPWGNSQNFHLYKDSASGTTGTLNAAIYQSGGTFNNATEASAALAWLGTNNDNDFHYVAQDMKVSGTGGGRLFVDGALDSVDDYANGQTNIANGYATSLGGFNGSNFNNCAIDEFRISLIQRPTAYYEANYAGGRDTLLTWAAAETNPGGGEQHESGGSTATVTVDAQVGSSFREVAYWSEPEVIDVLADAFPWLGVSGTRPWHGSGADVFLGPGT